MTLRPWVSPSEALNSEYSSLVMANFWVTLYSALQQRICWEGWCFPSTSLRDNQVQIEVEVKWQWQYQCQWLVWFLFVYQPCLILRLGLVFPERLLLRQAFHDFQKVTQVASRTGRLGIFQMECSHRLNKSLTEASEHLGNAKAWQKMSSESFLSSVLTRYRRQIAISNRVLLGLCCVVAVATVLSFGKVILKLLKRYDMI